MPFLVWDSPSGRVVFELTRSLSVLGRVPGCDIAVEEASVSRRHALVELDAGKVRVTDLGSKGGTRINGADLLPDLPSTLEAGDFVNIGRVVLTYHVTPPPPQAARPAPAQKLKPQPKPQRQNGAALSPRPAAAAAPVAATSPVWKYVALGLAFVLVALVGAVVALQLNARQPVQVVRFPDPGPAPNPDPDPEPLTPEPETTPAVQSGPEMPAVGAGPSLAAPGALPPQSHAAVDLCPDLIGMEGDRFYPVRLRDWDRESVKALGSDGRLYRFDRSLVVRIEDRGDLERRAAELRRGLPQGELQGRIALARWCAQRFIEAEARLLAAEVLDLDSGNSEAKSILASLGDA